MILQIIYIVFINTIPYKEGCKYSRHMSILTNYVLIFFYLRRCDTYQLKIFFTLL